jgi:hypothetical protein
MGTKKGHFSTKGVSETPWGKKSKQLSATLSEEGYQLLKEKAKALKTSVSEVLERWARDYDVSFGGSQVLPAELDVSKDWKPKVSQLASEATKSIGQARESLDQASEALEELRGAITQDQEESLFLAQFIQELANGKIGLADLTELSGVIDLDDTQIERLASIIQLLNNQGGRQPNGV